MDSNRCAVLAILGIGAIIAIYYATQNDGDRATPVPLFQTEAQVMGMNVRAGMAVTTNSPNRGTPLDMSPELHFWAPGFDNPGLLDENHPRVRTRHRYPAIPGGNISTVMHKGWSCFNDCAPANNDWFSNPPEVAVL